jgi:hypothetical protein
MKRRKTAWRKALYAAFDFIFAFARQMRQSRHVQQKWVWQTISSN